MNHHRPWEGVDSSALADNSSDTTYASKANNSRRIKNVSLSSLIGRFLLKIGVYVVLLYGFKKYNSYRKEQQQQQTNDKKDVGIRSFRAGPTEVFVQSNFLPIELAERWRQTMNDEWNAMGLADNIDDDKWAEVSDENKKMGGSWRFATNNDGEYYNVNQKTRSLQNIGQRNESARHLLRNGAFSYAKWEFDYEHSLVKEIESFLTRQDTADKVKTAVGLENDFHPGLSDIFVTHFSTGDFLSTHDDGFAGTWAFVISLLDHPRNDPNWNSDEFGGVLRFECPYNISDLPASTRYPPGEIQWCEELSPSFNSAVFFRTRPKGPRHKVTPVEWSAASLGFRRYGITGWFTETDDNMTEKEKKERDKMRARTD